MNATRFYMRTEDSVHGHSDGIGPCASRAQALKVLREHYDALKAMGYLCETKTNFANNEIEEFVCYLQDTQRRRYYIVAE